MRRQMLHPYPRQDQESRVVRDEADIPAPRFGAPANVAVATAQVTRSRGPCQAGDRPALRPHQVLQVFAHWLLVAEIMVLFHQAVKQRLLGGAPNLLELQRLEMAQPVFYKRGVDPRRLRPDSLRQR